MSKGVWLELNLKQAYIIKHALRDMERGASEEQTLKLVTAAIDRFKESIHMVER